MRKYIFYLVLLVSIPFISKSQDRAYQIDLLASDTVQVAIGVVNKALLPAGAIIENYSKESNGLSFIKAADAWEITARHPGVFNIAVVDGTKKKNVIIQSVRLEDHVN